MKIVTKRCGKFFWLALKDKIGLYHCLINNSCISRSIKIAGHLFTKEELKVWKKLLQKEGHE